MPRNIGTQPETDGAPIDIEFRNGRIKRNVRADQWRWKPWDHGQSEWDIIRWQYSRQSQPQHREAA